MMGRAFILPLCCLLSPVSSFVPNSVIPNITRRTFSSQSNSAMGVGTKANIIDQEQLYSPAQRDEKYASSKSGNVAQYLVDLHDSRGTFDFCGGMMFQLVLSDTLRDHLSKVAAEGPNSPNQPVVFDVPRMSDIPNYERSANADNIRLFHGREVRKVDNAAGGMGFALHLSMASNNGDPERWTSGELGDYDGWGHDVGRTWRAGDRLAKEGFPSYLTKFGPNAFGLHHRFFLRLDQQNRIWLSAEDGCEGTPALPRRRGWIF